MTKVVLVAFISGALTVGLAVSAAAQVVPVKRLETAANLAMLKADLGAVANVTFVSDLPGAAEAADSLTAFGITRTGELRAIVQPGYKHKGEVLASQVIYYDDAAMTKVSDTVSRYVDVNGKELFQFTSDREPPVPEPGTWSLMLVGLGLAGAMLRHGRRAGLLQA
jgi:hypothetical protein